MEKKKRQSGAQRTALFGILVALAMILSYVETLIPLAVGIPGVKPGLANLVVFFALYRMNARDAFAISMIRILLVALTFGSFSSALYSIAGGILSFLIMWLCKNRDLLSGTGVSIAGGVSHNLGQLIVAALVLESGAVTAYLPVLLLSGTVTGALIGLLGGMILRRLPQNF